jgi:hypothetical protein
MVSSGIIDSKEQTNLKLILQSSFEDIYLAKYGLEYPSTEERLNRCIKQNDKPCLNIYKRFEKGKKTITSLPASSTLDTTLDIIETACLSKDENIANSVCYGGIMSLYFYSSLEQDAKILTRVKKYPKKVRNLMFNNDFFWYYNRPDSDRWVTYLSKADIEWKEWEPGIKKKIIMNLFKKNISEYDGEPWVLR